jgi:hypothetical protein
MTSWTSKRQQELQEQRKKRLNTFLWSPIFFVAGIVFTLVFTQWFVPLLPGPRTGKLGVPKDK